MKENNKLKVVHTTWEEFLMHFSPTEVSAQNLLNEGKDKSKIYITGNTAKSS